MQNTMENFLLEAYSEALEKMAFVIVEPLTEQSMPEPREFAVAKVFFSGAIHGRMFIAADVALIDEIATNALGLMADDEQLRPKGLDALMEILNMTSGLLLPHLVSSDTAVFDVSLPEAELISGEGKWQSFIEDSKTLVYDADGYRTAVRLELDGEAVAVPEGSE